MKQNYQLKGESQHYKYLMALKRERTMKIMEKFKTICLKMLIIYMEIILFMFIAYYAYILSRWRAYGN